MIELTTSLVFLISTLYPHTAVAATTGDAHPVEKPAITIELSDSKQVETFVKAYFKDDPVLAKIAFCESTYRHTDKDGEIIRGLVNKNDIGVMQINEGYHKAEAEKLGLDLHKFEDNLAYAQYLYDKQGTQPWKSSKPCWGQYEKTVALAK